MPLHITQRKEGVLAEIEGDFPLDVAVYGGKDVEHRLHLKSIIVGLTP